ncbi:hypothetical protein WAI453_003241 [Rhynchosporium graminicola]
MEAERSDLESNIPTTYCYYSYSYDCIPTTQTLDEEGSIHDEGMHGLMDRWTLT